MAPAREWRVKIMDVSSAEMIRFTDFLIPFLIGIIAYVVLLYVLSSLAFMWIGRKSGVNWSWVAWIPGGATFIVARVANWRYWALWPVLVVCSLAVGSIPLIGRLFQLAIVVVMIVQLAQLMQKFDVSWVWLFVALIPLIGWVWLASIFLRIGHDEQRQLT